MAIVAVKLSAGLLEAVSVAIGSVELDGSKTSTLTPDGKLFKLSQSSNPAADSVT